MFGRYSSHGIVSRTPLGCTAWAGAGGDTTATKNPKKIIAVCAVISTGGEGWNATYTRLTLLTQQLSVRMCSKHNLMESRSQNKTSAYEREHARDDKRHIQSVQTCHVFRE